MERMKNATSMKVNILELELILLEKGGFDKRETVRLMLVFFSVSFAIFIKSQFIKRMIQKKGTIQHLYKKTEYIKKRGNKSTT